MLRGETCFWFSSVHLKSTDFDKICPLLQPTFTRYLAFSAHYQWRSWLRPRVVRPLSAGRWIDSELRVIAQQDLAKQKLTASLGNLRAQLKQAWSKIKPSVRHNLITRMPKCIRTCIHASTRKKYLPFI